MDYFAQQLINGFVLGSIYGLIAIGYTMVYGIVGMINFAHGDIFMIGGFIALISFLALVSFGLTSVPVILLLMLLVAMAITALYGWTVERIAYRPLRHSFRLAPMLSAIGMSFILTNFSQVAQGARGGRPYLPVGVPPRGRDERVERRAPTDPAEHGGGPAADLGGRVLAEHRHHPGLGAGGAAQPQRIQDGGADLRVRMVEAGQQRVVGARVELDQRVRDELDRRRFGYGERGERSVSSAGHKVDQQMNLVEILLENQLVQLLSIPALRLCRFAAVMDWIAHCECSLKLCFYTLPK